MLLRANQWATWGLLIALQPAGIFAAALVVHKPAWEIAVPYLVTLVAPVLPTVLAAIWLRKWEERRPPPRLLALCWSLLVAILAAAAVGATLYYGTKLRLLSPTLGEVMFVTVAAVLSASVPAYLRMLPIIIARAPSL
jgi:hypothetical protein